MVILVIFDTKKPQKILLFKNNKMVFLYPFFPHTTIILFQVAKKRQAVHIENESQEKAKTEKMPIYKTIL